MGLCGRCKIETDGLEDGKICEDCFRSFRITEKGRDFVRWLQEKHPEKYEKALMDSVDDKDATQ